MFNSTFNNSNTIPCNIKSKRINKNHTSPKAMYEVDEFWNDCLQSLRNTQFVCNGNTVNGHRRNMSQKGIRNKLLGEFYSKYPQMYQEVVVKRKRNCKRREAERRCREMYVRAKENQKKQKMEIEENEKKKMEDEIKKCTWKPDLNKRNKKLKFSNSDCVLQIKRREKEGGQNEEDDTINAFQPKIYSNMDLNKVFNANNTLENKSNYDFLIRYQKARKERTYKRNKLISTKELSDQCILNGDNINNINNINNNDNINFDIDYNGCKMKLHKELNELTLNNKWIN